MLQSMGLQTVSLSPSVYCSRGLHRDNIDFIEGGKKVEKVGSRPRAWKVFAERLLVCELPRS